MEELNCQSNLPNVNVYKILKIKGVAGIFKRRGEGGGIQITKSRLGSDKYRGDIALKIDTVKVRFLQ